MLNFANFTFLNNFRLYINAPMLYNVFDMTKKMYILCVRTFYPVYLQKGGGLEL